MKHRGPSGLTRECSKCGGDLGKLFGKQRYCSVCRAKYMRDKYRPFEKIRIMNKGFNEGVDQVLKILRLKGYGGSSAIFKEVKSIRKNGKLS